MYNIGTDNVECTIMMSDGWSIETSSGYKVASLFPVDQGGGFCEAQLSWSIDSVAYFGLEQLYKQAERMSAIPICFQCTRS
jgi:hypothetical protein